MKRRGTALIGILCFLLMIAVAWGGRAAGDGPEPTVDVRVEPGDTLWSLARRHADDSVDIRELISDIRRINQLEDAVIHPGQTLKIPVRKGE
ncbi:LysM domain-containing protein [Planifilum fulgidum]|jgi:LysM repeat protein|uniref:LysM domain-containing protein n=1 Tax=Planifilum fulgidum TaxID=201973 RepID=A0A1I2PA27_9BACL|nr:LysM peptidoglycan-binding domain-containing protein [Planifilum fulgidum]MBO2496440.1 LysM peptidoglycan-binding domain-containing protein [Bacillota bacterium]MBO2531563.1 LysM peptidoglycan-binding domain-containing protein [Thermoactinomycetaceae bacterium]SFG12995.1 LysM domain-containing protein [Planifilum fulgidum]